MELPNVESVANDLATELNLSDTERAMVIDAMKIIYTPLPSSKSGASALIDELLGHKSNVFYIKSSISRKKGAIYRSYRSQVDNKFMILTRQGRPSKDAIYSEIHAQSGDLRNKRDDMDRLDECISVLDMIISMIDSKMRIVDSKRFDLGD